MGGIGQEEKKRERERGEREGRGHRTSSQRHTGQTTCIYIYMYRGNSLEFILYVFVILHHQLSTCIQAGESSGYWHSGWGEQWYIQYTGIQAGESSGTYSILAFRLGRTVVHTVYWHSGWGGQWYIQYTGIQAGESSGTYSILAFRLGRAVVHTVY